jgi:hypothetical protein
MMASRTSCRPISGSGLLVLLEPPHHRYPAIEVAPAFEVRDWDIELGCSWYWIRANAVGRPRGRFGSSDEPELRADIIQPPQTALAQSPAFGAAGHCSY